MKYVYASKISHMKHFTKHIFFKTTSIKKTPKHLESVIKSLFQTIFIFIESEILVSKFVDEMLTFDTWLSDFIMFQTKTLQTSIFVQVILFPRQTNVKQKSDPP